MASLIIANLLFSVLHSSGEPLPQVQPQGDLLPLFTRAGGAAARSRSCHNGTEFIVTFAEQASHEQMMSIMNDRIGGGSANHCRTLRHAEGVGQLNAMTVCIPPEQDVDAHMQVLLAMEGIEAVEENMPVNILDGQEVTATTAAYIPWHLDRIDQISLPLDGVYSPMGTGRGVRVYITDTGVDASHPEFEGRVTDGYSAISGQSAVHDDGKHGTHVAGLVGSKTFGVAKDVTIIPVKVFNDNGDEATCADIIEGINWAIAQEKGSNASAVLSMSLGMPGSFYAGDQALSCAIQAGLIPVVAAGNDKADACDYWPSQSSFTITVGSTDKKDVRSSFSNYGSCVDIYSPGSSITSTLPGGRIGVMSGTSMATPVVSGVVSLYLEQHPTAKFQQIKEAVIRNSVGLRNVVAARRMLLVQAKQYTQWALMANDQPAVPQLDFNVPQQGTVIHWALPLSMCCTALFAVFLLRSRSSKCDSIEPSCCSDANFGLV